MSAQNARGQMLITVVGLSMLLIQIAPSNADANGLLQGMNCSSSEVQIGIGPDPKSTVNIGDVAVLLRPSQDTFPCVLTFTAEAATSVSRPQLMVLSYQETTCRFVGGDQRICEIDGLDFAGPVLSVVRDGFDQTTTFVNRTQIAFGPPSDSIHITPQLASAFGKQFRIARHCLLVECKIPKSFSGRP